MVTVSSDPSTALIERLRGFTRVELVRREQIRDALFRSSGITFTVYGDDAGVERTFPMDFLPRIIPAADWERVDAGVIQRVTALHRFLEDLHVGEQAAVHGCCRWPSPNSASARSITTGRCCSGHCGRSPRPRRASTRPRRRDLPPHRRSPSIRPTGSTSGSGTSRSDVVGTTTTWHPCGGSSSASSATSWTCRSPCAVRCLRRWVTSRWAAACSGSSRRLGPGHGVTRPQDRRAVVRCRQPLTSA